MGHDPTEHIQEHVTHEAAHGDAHGHNSARWITAAAPTAAFLAAFAAVSSTAATSHLTESTLTRIEANDIWGQYNSKSVKKNDIQSRTTMINLSDPEKIQKPEVQKQIAADKKKLAEYDTKKEEDSSEDPQGMDGLKDKADSLQKISKSHLKTHETYEMSATMFHIAIAIVAIAVVAKRKEFWYISMVGGVVGMYFFASAFMHAPVEAAEHKEEAAHVTTAAGDHAPAGEHKATPAAGEHGPAPEAPKESPAAHP